MLRVLEPGLHAPSVRGGSSPGSSATTASIAEEQQDADRRADRSSASGTAARSRHGAPRRACSRGTSWELALDAEADDAAAAVDLLDRVGGHEPPAARDEARADGEGVGLVRRVPYIGHSTRPTIRPRSRRRGSPRSAEVVGEGAHAVGTLFPACKENPPAAVRNSLIRSDARQRALSCVELSPACPSSPRRRRRTRRPACTEMTPSARPSPSPPPLPQLPQADARQDHRDDDQHHPDVGHDVADPEPGRVLDDLRQILRRLRPVRADPHHDPRRDDAHEQRRSPSRVSDGIAFVALAPPAEEDRGRDGEERADEEPRPEDVDGERAR